MQLDMRYQLKSLKWLNLNFGLQTRQNSKIPFSSQPQIFINCEYTCFITVNLISPYVYTSGEQKNVNKKFYYPQQEE